MIASTSQGKKAALKALAERRKDNKDRDWAERTARGYAGSPMYFGCIACNGCIVVPENYLSKPNLCKPCQDMKEMGWLG